MKKLISMILAVILVMALACTAMAEETNGEKFDSVWAIQDAIVEIDQEEEGFRVLIISKDFEEGKGIHCRREGRGFPQGSGGPA